MLEKNWTTNARGWPLNLGGNLDIMPEVGRGKQNGPNPAVIVMIPYITAAIRYAQREGVETTYTVVRDYAALSGAPKQTNKLTIDHLLRNGILKIKRADGDELAVELAGGNPVPAYTTLEQLKGIESRIEENIKAFERAMPEKGTLPYKILETLSYEEGINKERIADEVGSRAKTVKGELDEMRRQGLVINTGNTYRLNSVIIPLFEKSRYMASRSYKSAKNLNTSPPIRLA